MKNVCARGSCINQWPCPWKILCGCRRCTPSHGPCVCLIHGGICDLGWRPVCSSHCHPPWKLLEGCNHRWLPSLICSFSRSIIPLSHFLCLFIIPFVSFWFGSPPFVNHFAVFLSFAHFPSALLRNCYWLCLSFLILSVFFFLFFKLSSSFSIFTFHINSLIKSACRGSGLCSPVRMCL